MLIPLLKLKLSLIHRSLRALFRRVREPRCFRLSRFTCESVTDIQRGRFRRLDGHKQAERGTDRDTQSLF